jgi:hypothetical protein
MDFSILYALRNSLPAEFTSCYIDLSIIMIYCFFFASFSSKKIPANISTKILQISPNSFLQLKIPAKILSSLLQILPDLSIASSNFNSNSLKFPKT